MRPDKEPATDSAVSLVRRGADGGVETVNLITDGAGTATASLPIAIESSDYQALAEQAESNIVAVEPVLP